MKSGFDFSEFKKWSKNLENCKAEFRVWLKTFLLQQAQRVVSNGKKRTPVDTGFLRNSWYIGSQKIVQKEVFLNDEGARKAEIDWDNSDIASIAVVGDSLEVEIGLSAEYASYIEYGHHSYAGRYMLTISIDEVQRVLPNRFEKEWTQFLKSKGVI